MTDWSTISSMATAGGTLVLAVATFSSVRSSNRSARLAELSLLTGLRPVLVPSREDDPVQRVGFGDGVRLAVPGHGGAIEVIDGKLYMALGLRNGGNGVAVLHGWRVSLPERDQGAASRPDPTTFRRQMRDLYVPAGDSGFWQGAIREDEDPHLEALREAARTGQRVMVDLIYGDHEGGQRTIARFALGPDEESGEGRGEVLRYWNLDREDPR